MVTIQLLTVTFDDASQPSAPGARGDPSAQDPAPKVDPPPWPNMAAMFPDFDQSGLPPIPEGWVDISHRIEQSPTFETPEGCMVYASYPDSGAHEDESATRYGVRVMEMVPGCEGWQVMGTNAFPDYDGDDWSEVLAHVAKVPKMRRAFAGARALEKVWLAVRELSAAYDEHDLNDIQPPHLASCVPMSIDEWECELQATVEAFDALAVGDEPEPWNGFSCAAFPTADDSAGPVGAALAEVRRICLAGHGTPEARLAAVCEAAQKGCS